MSDSAIGFPNQVSSLLPLTKIRRVFHKPSGVLRVSRPLPQCYGKHRSLGSPSGLRRSGDPRDLHIRSTLIRNLSHALTGDNLYLMSDSTQLHRTEGLLVRHLCRKSEISLDESKRNLAETSSKNISVRQKY